MALDATDWAAIAAWAGAFATIDGGLYTKFEITAEPGDGECRIMVKMLDGPPAIHVTISWISESPTGFRLGKGLGRYELVRNERIGFGAEVPPEADRGSVKVVLECSEVGDANRTWSHVEVVEWSSPTANVS